MLSYVSLCWVRSMKIHQLQTSTLKRLSRSSIYLCTVNLSSTVESAIYTVELYATDRHYVVYDEGELYKGTTTVELYATHRHFFVRHYVV